jgi:hypothetical protein
VKIYIKKTHTTFLFSFSDDKWEICKTVKLLLYKNIGAICADDNIFDLTIAANAIEKYDGQKAVWLCHYPS